MASYAAYRSPKLLVGHLVQRRQVGAAPGLGEVVGPAEMVEDHLQLGEAACEVGHPSDLARPRLDRGDQPLIGQKLEAVAQLAVRVGGRGRRAGLECRKEPDPHAGHQRIRPQRRHEPLEPRVGGSPSAMSPITRPAVF